jgi:hypothetical protein
VVVNKEYIIFEAIYEDVGAEVVGWANMIPELEWFGKVAGGGVVTCASFRFRLERNETLELNSHSLCIVLCSMSFMLVSIMIVYLQYDSKKYPLIEHML